MKNLSSPYQQRSKQYPVEIITTEITDSTLSHKLPRHINSLESKSHRGQNNFGQTKYKPRLCKLDPNPFTDPFSTSNLAWYIAKQPTSTAK